MVFVRNPLSLQNRTPSTDHVMSMTGGDLVSAPRLLIVEDDRATLLAISKIAEKVGFAIISATSLDQATRFLQAERCDCLTLDLSLGMDTGIKVISAIVQAAPGKPIVIISAAPPWVRNDAISAGQMFGAEIMGCVPKPIDFAKLRMTLIGLKENFHLNNDQKSKVGYTRDPSEPYYI